jgi:hypothetical protein
MTTQIERTEKMHNNPPNPMEVIQGIAVLQAITLGFMVGSQLMLHRKLRRLNLHTVVVNNITPEPMPVAQ